MKWNWLLAILYGLLTIWTGLLRGIEAKAFKPNALFFCLVMGLVAIAGGYVLRLGKRLAGTIVVFIPTAIVLAFYMYSFIAKPEGDATVRVGIIITASIAMLAFLFLPRAPQKD